MITTAQIGGLTKVVIKTNLDIESHMQAIGAMLRAVGLADKETPLTSDELFYITELIAAMLPAPEQIQLNANYHNNGKPEPEE